MGKISKEQFLERLQADWRNYPARFARLAPPEQAVFLEKQGYASFAALLSHVIAWWQDGEQTLQKMRRDPDMPLGEYDVDAFNAAAVQRLAGFSAGEVLQRFEAQRQAMADLVRALPEAELEQENVNTRLNYEIMMHWTEHALD